MEDQEQPPLTESALQERLRTRADNMRRVIYAKTPFSLRDVILVDDTLQEVWSEAFRSRTSFRDEGGDSLDRWLTGILLRVLSTRIREALAAKRGGDGRACRTGDMINWAGANLFEHILAPGQTPSSQAAVQEATQIMEIAMDRLSDQQRAAIRLQFFEGRSRRDIAQVMGTTEAAVNSLVFNGLKRLREFMGSDARYFSDAKSASQSETIDSNSTDQSDDRATPSSN